ncbi:MAG: hypothetical protein ACLTXT_04065 [Ruminococcus callidus]
MICWKLPVSLENTADGINTPAAHSQAHHWNSSEKRKSQPLSMAEYVQITAAQLTPPSETVIERLTGDGTADCLTAPLWSLDKLACETRLLVI